MNRLPEPTSTMQQVLHILITRPNGLTERDSGLNGFRARITEIRKLGIDISSKREPFINRFGRDSFAFRYFLSDEERKKAQVVYLKLLGADKK